MKSIFSLREFRYALLLAFAAGGWVLFFNQWQQVEQTRRSAWEGEASFIIVIPAYLLLVCTGLGALAYFSHAWQRWRNPAHPRAGVAIFLLLFLPSALIYVVLALSRLAERF